MPQKKATFHSKDPTSAKSDKPVALDIEDGDSSPIKEKYTDKERRRENQRQAKDRRTDVRFDLTKADRRETQGRREDDITPKFW
jgi:hypothetical protein